MATAKGVTKALAKRLAPTSIDAEDADGLGAALSSLASSLDAKAPSVADELAGQPRGEAQRRAQQVHVRVHAPRLLELRLLLAPQRRAVVVERRRSCSGVGCERVSGRRAE